MDSHLRRPIAFSDILTPDKDEHSVDERMGDMAQQSDFDVHGLLGIRLIDARPADAETVARQLGPVQRPLEREPDVRIRFVDRLELSSPLRLLGVDDAGFTDDMFLVLRGKHKSRVQVALPLADLGQGCELVVERGLSAIPLLVAVVNLTMVAKGILPLHAAAFEYRGIGALATGWAKGGKTEMLLAYAAHGARYVGDEWVYLTPGGRQMFGLPEPIRLWKWHFESMPEYWAEVGRGQRTRLEGLAALNRSLERLADTGLGPLKALRRVNPVVQRQLNVLVPPERLFATRPGPATGVPSKVFFVASHAGDEVVVEPADPAEVARRMVFSFLEEHADLMSAYRKFRFAFPDARSDLLDTLEARVRDLLLSALADKETYAVYHPHPAPIPALYEATCGLFPTG